MIKATPVRFVERKEMTDEQYELARIAGGQLFGGRFTALMLLSPMRQRFGLTEEKKPCPCASVEIDIPHMQGTNVEKVLFTIHSIFNEKKKNLTIEIYSTKTGKLCYKRNNVLGEDALRVIYDFVLSQAKKFKKSFCENLGISKVEDFDYETETFQNRWGIFDNAF